MGLIHGLVSIPSLSTQEAAASAWLAAQMRELGYARACVDEAGNAVGELGDPDAAQTVVLLGHIDTVPGDIPVQIEESDEGPILYGRGSVDAKGPLATFVAAGALLGDVWARDAGIRLVVVGAVEEEAATSKGARFIRERFDGVREPVPAACLIGEPSGWSRVTLGYKGRLLIELDASQPMAHTAGPDAGIATVAVDLWNWIAARAASANLGIEKVFEQLQPSLRRLSTTTDEHLWDHVHAQVGIRLPPGYDVAGLVRDLAAWAGAHAGADVLPPIETPEPGAVVEWRAEGKMRLYLRLSAFEPAWRGERSSAIVRCLMGGVRKIDASARPAYVVKTGTSDMNVVGPAWLCQIAAYGPGDSTLDHTPHEHLNLLEYWKSVQVLAEALRDFSSILATRPQ